MEIGNNFASETFKVANFVSFVTRLVPSKRWRVRFSWDFLFFFFIKLVFRELQGAVIFCPPRKPWRSSQGFWVSGTISLKREVSPVPKRTVLPLKRLPLCKHLNALVCNGLSARNRSCISRRNFSLQIINIRTLNGLVFEFNRFDYFDLRSNFVSITIWKKIYLPWDK